MSQQYWWMLRVMETEFSTFLCFIWKTLNLTRTKIDHTLIAQPQSSAKLWQGSLGSATTDGKCNFGRYESLHLLNKTAYHCIWHQHLPLLNPWCNLRQTESGTKQLLVHYKWARICKRRGILLVILWLFSLNLFLSNQITHWYIFQPIRSKYKWIN